MTFIGCKTEILKPHTPQYYKLGYLKSVTLDGLRERGSEINEMLKMLYFKSEICYHLNVVRRHTPNSQYRLRLTEELEFLLPIAEAQLAKSLLGFH